MLITYLFCTPQGHRLNFGKHLGQRLEDVPVDYIRWALHEVVDAPEQFREILRAELDRRKHAGVGTLDFGEEE